MARIETTPLILQSAQIWADNDPRLAGRTLRVDAIEDGKVACTILTNDNETQAALQRSYFSYGEGDVPVGEYPEDRRGKTTRISVARFKPGSRGYRLIQGQQYGTPVCPECNDTGMVWVETCTCGVGPSGYYGMHERYCGAEPCSTGCPVKSDA